MQATPHASLSTYHSARQARNRGSVLAAVLGIILILSLLITRFMEEAMEGLEYRAIFNEPPEVRSFAYSLLEVALATVHEVALIDEGKLYAPEQGWQDPISYAEIAIPNGWEVQIQIQIQDEGGKLPINTVNQNGDLLIKLLEEIFEFDFGTARELVSTLQDWIDENDNRLLNGAESDDEYLRRNPPYKAANAPLQSLHELRYIKVWEDEFFDEGGQPNERFLRLSGLVTVLHGGAVNLNSAPAEILEILALEDGWQDDYLFDGLDQPYLTNLPESANTESASVEIGLLRVTVTLQRAEVPYALSALVEPIFGDEQDGGRSSGGNAPGSDSDDSPKTGAASEQESIKFPFRILQLNEYNLGEPPADAARYSTVDIDQ